MKKLCILLFGGCYEVTNVSTNDTWMIWHVKRSGWWPAKVDSWINPKAKQK